MGREAKKAHSSWLIAQSEKLRKKTLDRIKGIYRIKDLHEFLVFSFSVEICNRKTKDRKYPVHPVNPVGLFCPVNPV